MAASAPPPHLAAGWVGNNSQGGQDDAAAQKDLELKMSGMSLMTNYNNHGGGPPGMCSTVSTTASADAPHPHDSSIDHSAAGSFKGSTPSSPQPEVIGHEPPKGLSRPPGLGGGGASGHMASPTVGGPGHSKNSSATSPMLTLTPNSSVDGNSDLYSLGGGRQQSPFQGGETGPAMPFLRNDGRRGDENGEYGAALSNFGGSFDLVESDNDGLLGLDALRDRAYSSPGPMARSFESAPSLRGGLPPSRGDAGSEGRRRRGVSRDNSGRSAGSARPPLAGGNNSTSHSPRAGELGAGNSGGGGDLSLGGLVVPFHPSGGRSGDPSPTRQTQEAADLRGFGAIGRPEFSGSAQEWEPQSNRRRSIAGMESSVLARPDYRYGHEEQHESQYNPSRRRSIGTESGREFYQQHQHQHQQSHHHSNSNNHSHYGSHNESGMGLHHSEHGHSDQAIAHKFGSLPSLSSHLQQKRVSGHHQGQSQGQHHHQPYNPMMIPQPKHQRSYSQPGPNRNVPPPEHLGVEGGSVGRYPPQDLEASSGHYPRDPPRYIGAPPPHHARTHSGDSFRSAHSRRSASMSHGSLSNSSYEGPGMPTQKRNSQPNLGSGYYGQALPSMPRNMQQMQNKDDVYDPSGHQRRHTYEDDLTLLGEHIEVPADHAPEDGFGHGYGMSDRMRPQMATPEQMQPHYSGYEGAHIQHLPTAGAALPSPKVVFNVKFKRTQRSFVLGPRIQRDLKVGTYVKVEADRGEDLGIVIGKVAAEKYSFSSRNAYRSQSMSGIDSLMPSPSPTGLSPPGATDLKCIIRLATHDEVSLLAMKREEEEELLKICRTKVRQRGLPMNVVDAEYQFDRHKLTFFFEAEGRIDFRELVRDLFSMYKTRIWMQQLDKNVTTAGGTGVSPPPSSMIDYGTPIIAPMSEFSDTFTPMNGLAGGN